jgi:hypothetical protein
MSGEDFDMSWLPEAPHETTVKSLRSVNMEIAK